MKKLIVIVIVMIAAFYYYLEHDRPDNVRILRVGVECNFVPHNWEEDAASDSNVPIMNNPGFYAEGYDVQIAKLVAEKIGAQLIIMKIDWEELLNALEHKRIDAIFSGMADTEERKQRAAFTDTYEVTKAEYTVMVRKNSEYENAKSLSDLSGAAILGQKGTNFDTIIDQIPNVNHLEPAETVPDMIARLMNKKTDGIVVNLDAGQSYERLYSTNLTLIRFSEGAGFDLGFVGTCAGVRKDDSKLLNDINDAINSITTRQRQRIMDQTISRVWKNL